MKITKVAKIIKNQGFQVGIIFGRKIFIEASTCNIDAAFKIARQYKNIEIEIGQYLGGQPMEWL